MKILVAEDSQVVRQRLTDMLSRLPGADMVLEADDVASARRLLDEFDPEVAIVEMNLPDGNGLGLIDYARAQSRSVTLIVLTDYPYAQYRALCKNAGIRYFFDKAAEFQQAISVVRQLISSSPANATPSPAN